MAGYSGTPLPKKLGIKEGMDVGLLSEPNGFVDLLDPLPEGVTFVDGPAHVVIAFATNSNELDERFAEAITRIPADGAIWIGWPKQSSPIPGDLVEQDLRDRILPTGLVDNKVCAIDEDWSGLRFVARKEHRPDWTVPA